MARSELPGHRQQIGKSAALSVGAAALIMLAAVTRAREAAPIPARSDADRPAPAGSAALRLLADVDSSFSRNCCWQIRRWTLALGRPAPMLTAASPGRGGGDGAGAAASYRVIGNDRKFRSTDSGSALTTCAAVTRAREAAPIPARSDADRPAPAGWAALRLLADVDSSFSRNCCWQIRRRTLALGRPAPMLTSASPDRAAAMVPAPQRATGSSATIANSAAPTVVQR